MLSMQYNKDVGGLFAKVLQLCMLFIDMSASVKIVGNSVIISAKKTIPVPLLVFHLAQAFGTAIQQRLC